MGLNKWMFSCSLKRIALVVAALHAAALLGLIVHHRISSQRPPAKIIVRTIEPVTSVRQTAPVATTAPAAAAATGAAIKPAAKKASVQTPSKAKPSVSAKALEEIRRNWQELESAATPAKKGEISIPKEVAIATPVPVPSRYEDVLVAYLQSVLQLPEYGEVKVHLQLDSQGNLLQLEILEMKHPKNGEFLKKRLWELAFPRPDEGGSHDFECTVVFKNRT